MPRIADALERESRTVDLEQGDFERLLGRRARKQRNRRIRAGALGVIVALAMGIALVKSFRSDHIPANPPVQPRPAPAASGTLTYVLDGDIYVADPDGSNAVKVADGLPAEDCYGFSGEYWAEGPMWSPDGRYLAYRRYTDCSSSENPRDVVISDSEGNVLAMFPATGWDIAWSPDSTRVAVWDGTFETIGVYGLDGAQQTQLTMPPGWRPSGDHDPVWMPNGTSLMVDNVEVPLDGGTPRQLPREDARSDPDATSPDGTRVAYVDHKSLVVAAVDGSDAREVEGRWALDPVWSPTGDRIAFIYSEKNVYASNELRVLDVATGDVTSLAGMGGSVEIWNIQFAPEGDRILFTRTEDGGRGASSLWSVGVDGSDARLVVAGTTQGEWLSR
jgi:hypothetical protein